MKREIWFKILEVIITLVVLAVTLTVYINSNISELGTKIKVLETEQAHKIGRKELYDKLDEKFDKFEKKLKEFKEEIKNSK